MTRVQVDAILSNGMKNLLEDLDEKNFDEKN